MKNCRKILLSLCFFCLSATAYGKDYKVEVLLFKNLNEQQAFESMHYTPPVEPSSGSEFWTIEPSMLIEQAETIVESSDYELISHLSWGQESLPQSKSATFALALDDANGWIKVYANQLLYINLDLEVSGYRLEEKRRIKLNERHFFDHPKFGLLVQVSRLEKKLENDEESNSTITNSR